MRKFYFFRDKKPTTEGGLSYYAAGVAEKFYSRETLGVPDLLITYINPFNGKVIGGWRGSSFEVEIFEVSQQEYNNIFDIFNRVSTKKTQETDVNMESIDHSTTSPYGDQKPHACPICDGIGLVPGNFYTSIKGEGSSTNLTTKCRSCQNGIIWG